MENIAIRPMDILLPASRVDQKKWACVACDQYTSQPEYWERVEAFVGDAPSTLRLMLPECWLSKSAELLPSIRAAMRAYLTDGTLETKVHNGFVLTERTTAQGKRLGLVAGVDLETYDFSPDTLSLVRPTEQTVRSRLPARQAIRRGAPVELPHIMMLADDPARTVIEPVYAIRDQLPLLYDTELMENGGHLRGWALEGEIVEKLLAAVTALKLTKGADPLLFAVGDGNHSLATAKVCWEELKAGLTPEQQENHPARYALAEIVNIHDEALNFEPIHRVVTHVDAADLFSAFHRYAAEHQAQLLDAPGGEQGFELLTQGDRMAYSFRNPWGALAAETLQSFLDAYLADHPDAGIDYIHGEDVVARLSAEKGTLGFLLPALDKSRFFDILAQVGIMPRKTFSLGEANEKRFYMECRSLEV